jgi:hypothetical protein
LAGSYEFAILCPNAKWAGGLSAEALALSGDISFEQM